MKKELQSIKKELKAIGVKLEKLIKAVDKAGKKGKATPAKKARPKKKAPTIKADGEATAYATVVNIISRSKNGVNTETLMKKTGFDAKKIANIIYKAKNKGKIKTAKKGVYIKA